MIKVLTNDVIAQQVCNAAYIYYRQRLYCFCKICYEQNACIAQIFLMCNSTEAFITKVSASHVKTFFFAFIKPLIKEISKLNYHASNILIVERKNIISISFVFGLRIVNSVHGRHEIPFYLISYILFLHEYPIS